MRIAVKKRETVAGQAADVPAETTTSYEVPTSSIAKLSALAGVILTVVQALTSLLSAWVVEIPKGRAQIEIGQAEMGLVESNFKIQMLQRVLENEDEKQRANSLRLLLATGLLSDPKGTITELSNTPGNIPVWKARELESLKETLPILKSGRQPQEAPSPSKNTNANLNTNKNGNTKKDTAPVDPPTGG